jgi:hypothetical protein
MRALIQTKDDGEWMNENCFSSSRGFKRMGYDVDKFNPQTLPLYNPADFDKYDVVHGGIIAIRTIFDIMKVKQPEIHNPHDYLPKYIRREMKEVKMADILDRFMNETTFKQPIFIKPLTEHKLFTGKVINSFSDLIPLAGVPSETDILQSEVVEYISEYRCFVNRRTLVGSKHYTGNFEVLPDFDMVYGAINDYKEQPISYSIDFGIDVNNKTSLVEINDGFALGSYGLNPIIYCKMIQDRWKEITKNKL